MSDTLARASTGDGFSKRKLRTDNDDIVYYIQRPIALNGINQVVMKPDLLDRSILIQMEAISPENRMFEEDLWQAFEHDKPQLLGAIFDVLAKALAIYPTIELSEVPRMADFTRWGCAIAKAAGYTQEQFLDAYRRNIERQNDEAIEASPVAKTVIAFMDEQDSWEGTAAELLTVLNKIAFKLNLKDSRYWPNDPARMGRGLNDVHATLSTIGIRVEHRVENNSRIITITKDPEVLDIPDFPEDNSNTANTVGL